jgi:hypothetical protein
VREFFPGKMTYTMPSPFPGQTEPLDERMPPRLILYDKPVAEVAFETKITREEPRGRNSDRLLLRHPADAQQPPGGKPK